MAESRVFVDVSPIRRYPEFRQVFLGSGVSQIGMQLGTVATAYQVFALTHSNLDVGFISLAQLVPALIGSIFGGAIADAIDRRTLLIWTGLGLALCASGLAINSLSRHPLLLVIYALSAMSALIAGCDSPTRSALLITAVDREHVVSANALRQLLWQVSVIVGPSIGGVLLSSGIATVYWINAGSIVLSLISVFTIAPRPPDGGGTKFGIASVVEGIAFMRTRPAIVGSFIVDIDAMVLGMPTALFPALGLVHFHGGARDVGFLDAAPGVGALIGTIFSGWTGRIRRLGLGVCLSIVIWGVAIAVFGLLDSFPIALVLLAVAGAADVISAIFRGTILQVEAPDRLRGRLSALHIAVVTGGPRLGGLEAGGVAAAFGTSVSVVSGGVGCVVGIALISRLIPKFLAYEMPSVRAQPVESDSC